MSTHLGTGRSGHAGGQSELGDWSGEEPPARDWKKAVLIAGLGILSWVATYVGMLELIEANMGELPLVHKVIIGFSVGMLMIMIVWLLDQLFAPISLFTKTLYALGYVFLTAISVGFGFGFYWKVLESRSEASRSAEGAVGQVQGSLFAASTRLDQLQQTLDSLTQISKSKAENERASGTSCPASKAGDGPRRKMREDDAARFTFASDFVKSRAAQVKIEIGALDADLARIVKDDRSIIDPKTGTRNDFMKSLGRKLDNTVTGFNAFRTDPQLKQIRADLAERADKVVFPDSKGGSYACPDPQLAAALKGVVRAIDGLPDVEKPRIATVEGSEATIEAFRRLTASFQGVLTFKLPPSADEQRELQKKAVQSVENPQAAARAASLDVQPGLSKRDYVPLAIALFVDLCLLLVSMGRPINRLQGLLPKMRAAERGPVIQILSRFSDIHRDEGMRESFEVLRHVVFDYAGAYYVAVPLDAPYTETRREQVVDPRSGKARLVARHYGLPPAKREELRVEAHLIGNLFASFEKEAVFKRVMWVNTDAARKQLARQGSKFANSEAFRIYRFSDGAWSEIILGAVMGAARRVETRRERDPDLGTGRLQPSLDALAGRMREAEAEAAHDWQAPRPKPAFNPSRHPATAGLAGHGAADPAMEAQFGPYARRAQAETRGGGRRTFTAVVDDPANSNTRTDWGRHERTSAPVGFTDAPAYAGEPEALPAGAPEPGNPETGNVVPFKQQRPTTDDDQPDMRLPSFMVRGQTALAARHDSTSPDVTVTATERRFSFSVPMTDPRIETGLYGIAAALKRAGADQASLGAEPYTTSGTGHEGGAPAAARTPALTVAATVAAAVVPSAQPIDYGAAEDRPSALSLPAPTREHEHRG